MNSDETPQPLRLPSPKILLTGATGYIGGRFLKALEKRGDSLRCLARNPAYLRPKTAADVEVVAGDVLDKTTLVPALRGIHTAYYLVHSMGAAGNFEEEDRRAARNFGAAVREAGMLRGIVAAALHEQQKGDQE